MNILVKTFGKGGVIVRPDTTWERDSEDLYLPESVTALSFTPVLFARISKPGRSVSVKFASRYYDGIGVGVLLYPENFINGSETGFARASCLDHSSFLPYPVFDPLTLTSEEFVFVLKHNGNEMFRFSGISREMIEKAIGEATEFIYVRSGDILAIELDTRNCLDIKKNSVSSVSASLGTKPILDFKIFS